MSALSWLQEDLDQATQNGKFIVLNMHDWSQGRDVSKEYADENFALLEDVLRDQNIVAVFAGHIHQTRGQVYSNALKDINSAFDFIRITGSGLNKTITSTPIPPVFLSGAVLCGTGLYVDFQPQYFNVRTFKVDDSNKIPFDLPMGTTGAGQGCTGDAEEANLRNTHFFNNQAPSVSIIFLSSNTVNEGEEVYINTQGFDPEGKSMAYTFFCDGSNCDLTGGGAVAHAFPDDETPDGSGSFLVKVEVEDRCLSPEIRDYLCSTGTTFVEVVVRNVSPIVTAIGSTIDENGVATVSGTITDPGILDSFDVTIEWGEGAPDIFTRPAGATTYSRTHQYPDNDPSSTTSNEYDIEVTVTDKDGGVGNANTTVIRANVPPIITAMGSIIDENGVATVSGTITDPDTLDSFEVTIKWGEGAPDIFTRPAGATTYSRTHQYLDDNPTGTPSDDYAIAVTVTDDDGGVGNANTTVTVDNVPPIVTATDSAIDENGIATVSGSITDPGTLDSFEVTIKWGEGASDIFTRPAGATTYSRTHQYLDDNPTGTASDDYAIAVTVTDDDGGVGNANTTVTVDNLDPVISSLTGDTIDENGTATVSGNFSDTGTEDSFTVTIDWNDGGPRVDYAYPADATGFSESHQYLDDNPTNTLSDIYPIGITVTDDDGGEDTGATTVTVDNVDPVASIDSVVDKVTGRDIAYLRDGTTPVLGALAVVLVGTTIEVRGSYTDIGSLDLHSLPKPPGAPDPSIDWDDGTVDDVAVVSSGVDASGAYGSTDTASHVYATDLAPGTYTIVLTVTDDDTGSDAATAVIEVVNAGDALQRAIDGLADLVDGGGLSDAAETALTRALTRIDGDPDDAAGEGALDHWDMSELIAALVKIRQAIDYLQDAEAADAALDLTAAKSVLGVVAGSIVQSAIDGAEAVATKNSEFKKIDNAEDLRDSGDAALTGQNYIGALDAYIDAVRKVENIIN